MVTLFLVTFVFVVAFAAIQPLFEPDRFAVADRIVVLGAGMDADGTLHLSTKLRVEKAFAIYQKCAAPAIHFTGGIARPEGPSAGQQMAQYAIQMGVPKRATTYEGKSQSTLQNALFSIPYLKNNSHIILVTEGFHLPRSWVSMKLFGDYNIALAHSVSFRQSSPNSRYPQITMCLREALAIWFNAGRYIIWQLSSYTSMDTNTRNNLLH